MNLRRALTLGSCVLLMSACSGEETRPREAVKPLAEVSAAPPNALVLRGIEGVDEAGCAQPGPNALTGDEGQSCYHLSPQVVVVERLTPPQVETMQLGGVSASLARIRLSDAQLAEAEALRSPATDEVEAGLLAALIGGVLLGEGVIEGEELVISDLDPTAVKLLSQVPRA